MAFEIRFEDEAVEHLDDLNAREQSTILAEIKKQLVHQPNIRTRHRKQLRSNSLAKWQLSIGDFRVFYDVDESRNEVVVLALGIKIGNR